MYTSNGLQEFYADERFKGLFGQRFSVCVIDAGFDIDYPGFGKDLNQDGAGDQILRVDLDFTSNKNGITDGDLNHGTAVLGVIDTIARGVRFIPMQVTTVSGITEALKWVIDNVRKYNIIAVSMSMGDGMNTLAEKISADAVNGIPTFYTDLENAVNKLAELNVAYSVAAGNAYTYYQTDGVSGIGAFEVGFNVSNIDSTGLKEGLTFAKTSQRRPDSIGAPGQGLLTYKANDGSVRFAGTSAATPFFTGCIILLQSVARKFLNRRLTLTELDTIVNENADPVGETEYLQINVFKSAQAILTLTPSPAVPPVVPSV